MSIAQLARVTAIVPQVETPALLEQLQQWGRMHLFGEARSESASSQSEHQQESLEQVQKLAEQLRQAIRYLRDLPRRRHQVAMPHARLESRQLAALVEDILTNEHQRRAVHDRLDALRERQRDLYHWGNFRFPEGETIGGYRLWFYRLPRRKATALERLPLPWQIVYRDNQQLWLVVISVAEPAADLLPCARVRTGRYSLHEIDQQISRAEIELDDLDAARHKMTRYLALLERAQAQARDISTMAGALRSTRDLGDLTLVRGWVASEDMPALQSFCERNRAALLAEPVTAADRPPTLLDNPPRWRAGEWLVNFYQTPAYSGWDPTIALFVSFALFFAMILSDAGYAALMLLALGVFWRRLGGNRTGSLLRPLGLTLALLSLVWGVLVGSYFGRPPPAGSLLQTFDLFDLNDFNTMMTLSIGCGIAHLLLANLQQIWLYRHSHRAVLHSGWCGLLVCAPVVFALRGDRGVLFSAALGGSGLALVAISAGAGERPVRTVRDVLWRALEGLRALTKVTNLFGDVLSYLRLFALGLASSSLALTFNDLADQAFASAGGFSVVAGLAILLIGHSLNLMLGIVSGVVHGLRLNFIEFYKWALYGEGYPFRAFKKQESSE